MSFRRFLYLVANDGCAVHRGYSLHRIDTSRFFFRWSTEGIRAPLDSSGGAGAAADPSAVEDGGRLPDPVINLCPPHLGPHRDGWISFVLFKNEGNDEGHDKVVAMDNTGSSLMCGPDVPPTVRYMPSLCYKFAPFSLTVGDSLYVMDALPKPPNCRGQHNFELPSPRIDSYAVVAGASIAVSNNASAQTFLFDTANRTWSKAGGWVLPFARLAEYLPQHRLWFGVSPIEDGYRFCATNLVAWPDSGEMTRPPVVHGLWREPPPKWRPAECYAVHLGSSRFCIVRFFVIVGDPVHGCPDPGCCPRIQVEEELQAVVTGVEVESCGDELRVVKHKSERYKLELDHEYQVL
ncbi:hypothetical protein C2845_PM14G01710 [Panicum miliaceum]|uniref:F-box/kelch-repeat protein n=1 Tax=Panicum miliaceum TaxID=4540 RepID=A0A3L6PK31_PANMI|nr:hypothetical protein C2845_PM14G01710 [Panicum miliaceum]